MNTFETIAVISAYNEQNTIGPVVGAALHAREIDAVILVDDGSTDFTTEVADCAAGPQYTLPKPFIFERHVANRGKAEAMLTGATIARDLGGSALSTLVFLDADLSPLWSRQTVDNQKLITKAVSVFHHPTEVETHNEGEFIEILSNRINQLTAPVKRSEMLMTIAMLQRNIVVDYCRVRLNWGALGGNRAVSASIFEDMVRTCAEDSISLSGWEIEAALNTYTRKRKGVDGQKLNQHIGKFLWDDVVNVGSRSKERSFTRGIMRMSTIHSRALLGFAKFAVKF